MITHHEAFITLPSDNLNPPVLIKSRSSRPEVFCRKGVLRNFAKSTGKHLCHSLFFNKVAGLKKEALAQVFSCEFCEISKSIFFYRTPPVAVSANLHRQFVLAKSYPNCGRAHLKFDEGIFFNPNII